MKFAVIIAPILAILLGIFAGFAIAQSKVSHTSTASTATAGTTTEKKLADEVGQKDAASFRDKAEGVIQKNDKTDGENFASGTHKLIRGDDSQTAYLTSSVLDLDQYIGKDVTVYGETFSSSSVGWLMDVGRVEVK